MNTIVIPVYNDWKSLNRLLIKINDKIKQVNSVKILVVDDFSKTKCFLNKKKFNKLKEIKILRLNQNLGSQKAIAIGLEYLKKLNKNFYITVMDGDGEDDPSKIDEMINAAKKYKNYIIVSCRKKRNEKFIFQIAYRLHLFLSFLLTGGWINFGNFSCFHSKNLKSLLSNNSIWFAYSSAVLKNTKIKRLYAERKRRYFENSKVNFLQLLEHSMRVMGVFYNRVFLISLIYTIIVTKFFVESSNLIYSLILLTNFLILFVLAKNYIRSKLNYSDFLKNIKKI